MSWCYLFSSKLEHNKNSPLIKCELSKRLADSVVGHKNEKNEKVSKMKTTKKLINEKGETKVGNKV